MSNLSCSEAARQWFQERDSLLQRLESEPFISLTPSERYRLLHEVSRFVRDIHPIDAKPLERARERAIAALTEHAETRRNKGDS